MGAEHVEGKVPTGFEEHIFPKVVGRTRFVTDPISRALEEMSMVTGGQAEPVIFISTDTKNLGKMR